MLDQELNVKKALEGFSKESPAARNLVTIFREFSHPDSRIMASITRRNIPAIIGVFGASSVKNPAVIFALIEEARMYESDPRYLILQLRGVVKDPLNDVQDLRQRWVSDPTRATYEKVFAELFAPKNPDLQVNTKSDKDFLSSPVNRVWIRMQSRALDLEDRMRSALGFTFHPPY